MERSHPPESLIDLIGPDELREMQERFLEATGYPNCFLDANGAAISQVGGWAPVCRDLIRTSAVGHRRCTADDLRLTHAPDAGEDVTVYRCHAGIMDASAPVTVDGRMLGILIIGQVLTEPPERGAVTAYADELGLDPERYWKLYRRLPVVEAGDFRRAAGALHFLALALSDRATLRLADKRRRNDAPRPAADSGEKYGALLDALPVGVQELDVDGTILYANAAHGKIHGMPPGELIGKNAADLAASEEEAREVRAVLARIAKERPAPFRYSGKSASDRGVIDIFVDWDYLYGPGGELTGFLSAITDATRDAGNLHQLTLNESRYRNVFEKTRNGVAIFEAVDDGADFILRDLNASARQIEGRGADEAIGMSLQRFFARAASPDLLEIFRKVHRTGTDRHISAMQFSDERGDVWRGSFVCRLANGEVAMVYTDETERVRKEENRRRLFELSSDLFCVAGFDGFLKYINPAWSSLLGWDAETLTRRPFIEFVHTADRATVVEWEKELSAGNPRPGGVVNRWMTQSGEIRWLSWNTAVSREQGLIFGVARDVTRQKIQENIKALNDARNRQSLKMEALGRLAGGIAHDFNNILFPIIGFAEMLGEDLPEDDPLQENVEEILTGLNRAGDLVRRIVYFSSDTAAELKPVRIQPVIHEAVELMRATIPADILIETEIDEECGPVQADPTQIHQVVMNLVTNAWHAMEETGGRIDVRLKEVCVTMAEVLGSPLTPGYHARLSVVDRGTGMGPDIVERIFEPYFTTKEKGRGTGLGLSIVHGIAGAHGGDVRVESRIGKGTTIHVLFPRITQEVCEEDAKPMVCEPGGNEMILLVDDEAPIVRMAEKMLTRLGYRVSSATDPAVALERYLKDPAGFDLLVTDMTMPKMTGLELIRRVRQVRPELPAIICTGYSEFLNDERITREGIDGFVLKPVIQANLAATVRTALCAGPRKDISADRPL